MRIAATTLLILASVMAIPSALAAQRLALVVGNADYQTAPLKNPVNDASDMARALEAAGFEVILLTDATRSDLRSGIREFHRKLARAETGLFYYAGHGIQYRGDNYLVPIDAALEQEFEIPDETVSAHTILRAMEESPNPLNVVILDACRNNPFASAYRSQARGLARMTAPSGSIIAYATAPGDVAIDGDGRNGLYTKHLLEAIQVPGLSLEEVFKQVRIDVVAETSGKQTPWEESSLTGDFYFSAVEQMADMARDAMESFGMVAPTAPADTVVEPQVPDQAANDREFHIWNGIKDSGGADDFRLFLDMFPDGNFAPFARIRLQQLEATDDPGLPPGNFTEAAPAPREEQDRASLAPALTLCKEHLDANRLTTGEGGIALECYRDVLIRDPGNSEALAGLENIKQKYLTWTRSALNKGEPDRARRYLQSLGIVDPDHPRIEPLLEEADNLFSSHGVAMDSPSGATGTIDSSGEMVVRIDRILTETGAPVPALARTYALEGYPSLPGIHVTDRAIGNYDVIISGKVLAQTNRLANNVGGKLGVSVAGGLVTALTGGLLAPGAMGSGIAGGAHTAQGAFQPEDTIRNLEAVVELRALNRANGREIVATATGRRTAPANSDADTLKAAQLYALGSAIKIATGDLGNKINSTWLADAPNAPGVRGAKVENSLKHLFERIRGTGLGGDGEPSTPRYESEADRILNQR